MESGTFDKLCALVAALPMLIIVLINAYAYHAGISTFEEFVVNIMTIMMLTVWLILVVVLSVLYKVER